MASLVKQASLFPILLVNFVGTVGFSIVLPFLVFVVMKFGGNAIVYGLLAATYPAFQLIGSPILGKWSDTYGRKKILLLSNVGTSIGWLLFLFALFLPSNSFNIHIVFLGTFVVIIPLLMLFLARAIDGVTGGNISIANAYLADLSSDSTRSKNFGKMGNIFKPRIHSRSCTGWNFRGNYLWSDIACFSSINLIFGHNNCNSVSVKRIQSPITRNVSSRARNHQKSFFAGMQRILFGYKH